MFSRPAGTLTGFGSKKSYALVEFQTFCTTTLKSTVCLEIVELFLRQ
jgi:hypothetical protein